MRTLEDDTHPLSQSAEDPPPPFVYGDRTLFVLRAQSFELDSSYGTIDPRHLPRPVVCAAAEPATADPITRLEQKLDAAMKMIESLQKRIDSMDSAVARALTRM